ncbi:thiamine monophosphate synthase [Flammeovirgaceae bacterium 311]|nr:thiamine monophosphate synthase [Flammeovirgaceae bacterium 311]
MTSLYKMSESKTSLFRLLVITPEEAYPQETQWVNRLFNSGLQSLHLRKPGWSELQLLCYLEQIEACYHPQIMLHHGAGVPEQLRVKGLHFQQHTLPQVKSGYCVSCSVHSWQEYLAVEEQVTYAFISPFFNSISKQGYRANPELQVMPAEANAQKAVALGGVNSSRIEEVRHLGLGGAALLGAIWQSVNPLAAFLEIQKKLYHG